MSKLFISYRRNNWGFTHRLVDDLREYLAADIFVDVDSIDQADFENSIVTHLHNSDAVLLVISETTFAERIHDDDDWVRREIREALTLKIPLVLVRVDGLLPPEGLPEDIKDVVRKQGIPFYPEYYVNGVDKLVDLLIKVVPSIKRRKNPNPSKTVQTNPPSKVSISHSTFHIEWIEIPTGKVILKEGEYVPIGGQTFDVPTFTIAKYPVTNAQFTEFVKQEGYNVREYWIAGGWQQGWKTPRFWDDAKWNLPDYPVIGVSWYEAMAFCAWLSVATDENIKLPTEQQWQRAAQGDEGRTYPWGSHWNSDNCNNSVEKDWQKNLPSVVTRYEGKGRSPFGVVDMVGNIWEWCLTAAESGRDDVTDIIDDRILRGGSWADVTKENFRCDCRIKGPQDYRDERRGFRIVRS